MMNFIDLRRTLVVPLAVLLALSVPALADDIEDAAKLLKSGQHQQALERVNKLLAARPRDARGRFLKGLIFAEQGNAKDATEVFLGLTKDYPELPEPYNNLAVIYASQAQYDKARSAVEQSIRTHPSYATAYENLGDVYAKLASQAYDKALQFDSANPAAKNKLALVRELVGGSAAARPMTAAPAAAPAAPATAPAAPVASPKAATKAQVAAAAPAKSMAKPADGKAGNAEILDMVNAWAHAWSSKDVDRYLAFYGKEFKTPGGQPRAAWEKTRRERLTAPKHIAVTIGAPRVHAGADGQVSVTFRQDYRSDIVNSIGTTKTLVLSFADGHWLIQQERVGN